MQLMLLQRSFQFWKLLCDLGFHVEALTIIYYDRHSEIQVSNDPIAHNKMKHVDLHVH